MWIMKWTPLRSEAAVAAASSGKVHNGTYTSAPVATGAGPDTGRIRQASSEAEALCLFKVEEPSAPCGASE